MNENAVYTYIEIRKTAPSTFEIYDNTSQVPLILSDYRGQLNQDNTLTINTYTGEPKYNHQPWNIFRYVDSNNNANNFTPTSGVDLQRKLILRGFYMVNDVVIPPDIIDQDNIRIRKNFYYVQGQNSFAQVLAKINQLPNYTVTEKQLVSFKGFETKTVNGISGILTRNTVLYNMYNLGKGTYGVTATQLTSTNIEFINSQTITNDDIVEMDNTIINSLGDITDGNYLTVANQSQWDFSNDENTFFFTYTTDDVLYFVQFVGQPGVYNGNFVATDFVDTSNSAEVPTTGVQSVSGYGVDSTDPQNPVILEEIAFNPKTNFISTTINGTYLTYKTDTYRQIDLQPFVPFTISNTNEIFMLDNNDIGIIGNFLTDGTNAFTIILKKVVFFNNIISFDNITHAILPIAKIHGAIYHRGFIYGTTRPASSENTTTTFIKYNPYNLNEINTFQLPNDGNYIGSTTDIKAYNNNLYILLVQSTNTGAKIIKIDENLKNLEIAFLAGNISSDKRILSQTDFAIYNDEFYIPTINNATQPSAGNTIGMSVYSMTGQIKREVAGITVSTGKTARPYIHWITIYNGQILMTSANASHRFLIRLDSNTLAYGDIFQTTGSVTDDNSIIGGYVYLNEEFVSGIDTTPISRLLKVKYDNFSDNTIEISNYNNGYGSYGSINPILNTQSLKTKLSEFKNDLTNQTLVLPLVTQTSGDTIQNNALIGSQVLLIFKNNMVTQADQIVFNSTTGTISSFPYDANETILIIYTKI